MKIYHYSVFAAAPGGGKQFAIVEGVTDPTEMQRIAASSGQPLTGFILNVDSGLAEVRFFSTTKEKGSSDSGALVVGEHLRRVGAIQVRVIVDAGGERLKIFNRESLWWSLQENMSVKPTNVQKDFLMRALGLKPLAIDEDWRYDIRCIGGSKVNLVVPVPWGDYSLASIKPDLDAITQINQSTHTNGVVAFIVPFQLGDSANRPKFYLDSLPNTYLRFFAPAKGIPEDNAGSYTVASICGYFADYAPSYSRFVAWQGEVMGKPSQLFVHSSNRDGVAKNIQVGGKVELLEVTDA